MKNGQKSNVIVNRREEPFRKRKIEKFLSIDFELTPISAIERYHWWKFRSVKFVEIRGWTRCDRSRHRE